MSYTIRIEKRAVRELERLSPVEHDRISEKILALESNPHPPNSLRLKHPLSGFRLRVGDWRVFYNVDTTAGVISVYAVRHRREAYR